MLGLEDQRVLEATPRPREFLTGELGIPHSDVQLYRIRIECESLSEYTERLIVLSFIVTLMGALVVLFRTQERSGHREQASSSEGCYLPIVPGDSAKFNGFAKH